MAKSNNQKAKILYLEKMLRETGEHRVISMQKILENLEKQGIRAERKSIYDDVEVLRSFGMDIRYTRERPGGYYLAGESAGEEQPSEEPGLTAEAKEIHETKDIHETSVAGYRKLLEASAGTLKKEIKLLCTGAVQAEVRDFFGTDAEYKMKDSRASGKWKILRLADRDGRQCTYPETQEICSRLQRLSEITGKGL